jgi:hypothetical protein
MAMRRKIGPAYERSPIQRIGAWTSRNSLIVVASVTMAIVFWVGVNWAIDSMFNFLATGGDESVEKTFSSDDPLWITVKLMGSILIFFGVLKNKSK